MAEDTTEPVIQYAENLLAYGIGSEATITTIGNRRVYLQSIQVSEQGDVKTYKNNVGTTTALVIPERYQQLSCEGLMLKDGATGGSNPKKGDEVTGIPAVEGLETDGWHFRLEDFTTSWSNEDVTKCSMTIRGYKF